VCEALSEKWFQNLINAIGHNGKGVTDEYNTLLSCIQMDSND
jgi:hypothetical protein